MKLISLLSILFSFNTFATCKIETSSTSPFYVSSSFLMGNKIYENIRSLKDSNKFIGQLPIDSIVIKTAEKPHRKYQAIKVIQLANLVREEHLIKSRPYFRNLIFKKKSKRLKENQKGYIHKSSLLRASKFKFILKDQSILNLAKDSTEFIFVNPRMRGESFVINNCSGKKKYVFDIVVKKYNLETLSTEFELDTSSVEGIKFLKNIVALHQDQADYLVSIFHYLYLDRNFTIYTPTSMEYLHTLKLLKFPVDLETLQGPYYSYYYNPDNRGFDDIYLKPVTACAMLSVLRDFRKIDPSGHEVALGDMYHRLNWREHRSHHRGTCIDVRPLRNDGNRGSMTWRSKTYDRISTTKLIKTMLDSGGKPLYFNDPKIRRKFKKVRKIRGHDNHLHVCFSNKSRTVKETCLNIQE